LDVILPVRVLKQFADLSVELREVAVGVDRVGWLSELLDGQLELNCVLGVHNHFELIGAESSVHDTVERISAVEIELPSHTIDKTVSQLLVVGIWLCIGVLLGDEVTWWYVFKFLFLFGFIFSLLLLKGLALLLGDLLLVLSIEQFGLLGGECSQVDCLLLDSWVSFHETRNVNTFLQA
jgi:hypothetical protein